MKEFLVKYWLEAVFSVILTVLSWAYRSLSKRFKRKMQEDAAIREGVTALLHDRLYQECPQHIREGCVCVEDLKNIEYLYKAYHALGGNGTGTELYTRVKALKIMED